MWQDPIGQIWLMGDMLLLIIGIKKEYIILINTFCVNAILKWDTIAIYAVFYVLYVCSERMKTVIETEQILLGLETKVKGENLLCSIFQSVKHDSEAWID